MLNFSETLSPAVFCVLSHDLSSHETRIHFELLLLMNLVSEMMMRRITDKEFLNFNELNMTWWLQQVSVFKMFHQSECRPSSTCIVCTRVLCAPFRTLSCTSWHLLVVASGDSWERCCKVWETSECTFQETEIKTI